MRCDDTLKGDVGRNSQEVDQNIGRFWYQIQMVVSQDGPSGQVNPKKKNKKKVIGYLKKI